MSAEQYSIEDPAIVDSHFRKFSKIVRLFCLQIKFLYTRSPHQLNANCMF